MRSLPKEFEELDLLSLLEEDPEPEPIPFAIKDPRSANGLLVNGDITIFSGDGKCGKSFLSQALSVSLTTGLPFAEYFHPDRRCRVLYVDAEGHRKQTLRRWKQMMNGIRGLRESMQEWDQEDPPIRYAWAEGLLDLDSLTGQERLKRLVGSVEPDWVIFDSLVRYIGESLHEAHVISRAYKNAFRPTRNAVDGGVIIIAHLRKLSSEGSNSAAQRLYGSVDIRNFCDSHFAITKVDDNHARVEHDATRWDDRYPPFVLERVGEDKGASMHLRFQMGPDAFRDELLSFLEQPRSKEEVIAFAGTLKGGSETAVRRAAERALSTLKRTKQIRSKLEGRKALYERTPGGTLTGSEEGGEGEE